MSTKFCRSRVSSVNEKAFLASCRVAYRVAKTRKYTVAENLILSAAMDIVEMMLSKQEADKVKSIPLSDNSIKRRIDDMADESIIEDILFCKALFVNTTGQCMYDLFLESTRDYEIVWTKCIAICSDGAKAMTGNKSGLVAKLKSIMSNVTWIHCFHHRQALVSKILPSD
ncbi:hypothetical protein ILUMI_23908 [Ignelater luminosus]|uniref:Uncharacterized protein n=1 Tax=Ignelater luminosus TaxID=2038154 RepID=A0A8K0C805_IGNLU|nr:hypothetical protein ILUMI_23908 [Ignelater luminosus]